jgi:hypothetical protein
VRGSKNGLTLSALALAGAVLVKGMPLLAAPVFIRRWGLGRVILFGVGVALPLVIFAAGAGWGLSGEADGRGVFGALRIYAASWTFNSGLYLILEKLLSPTAARLISVVFPAGLGLLLGWKAWRGSSSLDPENLSDIHHGAGIRRLVRWSALPLWVYLILAPTVHPWYLTLVLALLPFFWQAPGEDAAVQRWIYPWVYFMVFEAFTYLSYIGLSAPDSLEWIQLAGYLPFWTLLIWAGFSKGWSALDMKFTYFLNGGKR